MYRHDYEYVYNLFAEKGCKLLSEEYINANTPLKYKCSCGNIAFSTLANFRKISGCNICSVKSKGEIKIKEILDSISDIEYISQYSFNECKNQNKLLFDFAIIKDNDVKLLIEYDGLQHYEPIEYWGGEERYKYVKQNDEIKNNYCIKNNLKLLRIPYWEYDNIKEIVLDAIECVLYQKEPKISGSFFIS